MNELWRMGIEDLHPNRVTFCSFVIVLISSYFLADKHAIIVAINLTGSISRAHKHPTTNISAMKTLFETNECECECHVTDQSQIAHFTFMHTLFFLIKHFIHVNIFIDISSDDVHIQFLENSVHRAEWPTCNNLR